MPAVRTSSRQLTNRFDDLQGIIVQDLKPSNVLLDERQQLFIADYGLAANLEASIMSTRSSVAHAGGTEAYMAPEQLTTRKASAR